VLIGHSFGGFIATLYAAEFPDHVKALVLLAPAGVLQLPPPKGTPDLFQTIRNKLQELGNTAHLAEFETFYNRYFDFGSLPNATEKSLARLHAEFALHFERASGDDFSQEEMDAMVDDDKIGGLACFATYLSMGFQHNYKPQLQKVFRDTKFPVLIVHGNQDLVPVSSSKEYQELFPSATLQVLDGANHFLHDDPRVSECIQDILSQV
jgi:proline iminopeptidase